MRKIGFVILLVFSFLGTDGMFAQVMSKEIPLKQQIEKSSLVVEGEVIAKQSFWDVNHQNIYTANTIKIFKVFKGEAVSEIEIVTIGGAVGFNFLMVSPSLELQKGDIGVFALKVNSGVSNLGKSVNKQFKPYTSLQSFYKYNLYSAKVVNPYHKKPSDRSSFYGEIMNHTKLDYVEMSALNIRAKKRIVNKNGKVLLAPTNITFSPSTASAGTKTVLTISGSGFGGTQGRVGFSNADDGGGTYIYAIDSQILGWSDNQITVEIPSKAGTGEIVVEDSSDASDVSGSVLTISYAESNAYFDPDGNGPLGLHAYQVRHVNDNGNGGYTWQMQTDFYDDTEFPGAKAVFEKVLDQWRCETKINWNVSGSATTIDVVASDGVNVVKFDNAGVPEDDLANGVLGQCFIRISACELFGQPGVLSAYVEEFDIVFDDETNWFLGEGQSGFSEYDFESVVLHELGHAHQLAHVIDVVANGDNLDDVMHYAISNGEQQRVLSTNNVIAANNIQDRSTSISTCSKSVMTNSSVCNLSTQENEFQNGVSFYPNPARGAFYIKNTALVNLEEVRLYDLGGRLISVYDVSNTSGVKTISLAGISTGVYFVNIHSGDAFITKKIIVK